MILRIKKNLKQNLSIKINNNKINPKFLPGNKAFRIIQFLIIVEVKVKRFKVLIKSIIISLK